MDERMRGLFIIMGALLFLWLVSAGLRYIKFFTEFQFIVVTVAIVLVALWIGRLLYIVVYQ